MCDRQRSECIFQQKIFVCWQTMSLSENCMMYVWMYIDTSTVGMEEWEGGWMVGPVYMYRFHLHDKVTILRWMWQILVQYRQTRHFFLFLQATESMYWQFQGLAWCDVTLNANICAQCTHTMFGYCCNQLVHAVCNVRPRVLQLISARKSLAAKLQVQHIASEKTHQRKKNGSNARVWNFGILV